MPSSNPLVNLDPVVMTGLLRQIPISEKFIWQQFVSRKQISGTKWSSKSKETRGVRAGLIDHASRLPIGLKGISTKIEGDMVKVGITLPIDPDEIKGHDANGTLDTHLKELAESAVQSVASAYEYAVLRGMFEQVVALDGGAVQDLGVLGDTAAAAINWQTLATADGITDLYDANELLKDVSGNGSKGSSRIIMSEGRWRQLRKQAATQKLVFSTIGSGQNVNDSQLTQLILDSSLPIVQLYDGEIEVRSGGTFTLDRIVPEDLVLLVAPSEVFPSGFGEVFEGETSDQIIQARGGLVPANLGGGIFGFFDYNTNPGRIDMHAQVLVGVNVWELCKHSVGLDVDSTNGFGGGNW